MNKILDWNDYLDTAAQAAAEGVVMLKNNNALPLDLNETVSVFGRIQLHYYKSGTGSGGMINVSKVIGITDGLIEAGVKINSELLDIYKKWDEQNPYDLGKGWGAEPWSQAEMPLDGLTVENAAKKGGTAIVVIGRTAGEEQEVRFEEGSFLLTSLEKDMLTKVRRAFKKTIVLLNTGGLTDIEFIESCSPDALLLVWQGGMVGGRGTADVLTGRVSPSGKLPDTIAFNIEDYPSHPFFGGKDSNCYAEDIYVGYRYFDTFAPEKVRYPFGFGLSYTEFDIKTENTSIDGTNVTMRVRVENKGSRSGKEVVMMFLSKPQGSLGQPEKLLCAFEKTSTLAPGESQVVELFAELEEFASYDDSGASGHKNCFVLEKGSYLFFIKDDSAKVSAEVAINETKVVKKCEEALAPVRAFDRIKPVIANDKVSVSYEPVPPGETDENKKRLERLPAELPYTGDKGIKLADVLSGQNTLDEFIQQLSDNELSCIIRGEGMGSPKVTAGTASAFGGSADCLEKYGLPAACCSDGPSGMRLDCGTKAFCLPNGTMLAASFNKELNEKLYSLLGLEMTVNKVDCLLGPGMNIHRHPLNGRNFEYFSEDPYLTGMIAAAQLKGLHSSGVTGTLKHFCANNQETNRHYLDSVVSQRALREIYLRGFELAVKYGGADSIMTTYGRLNGVWTAGSYDLNTAVLRDEWGFDGITMTDWWANINRDRGDADKSDFASMAKAQNDLYMVCADSDENDDNTLSALESGDLKRCELQRNAKNICRFLLSTNALKRLIGTADTVEVINRPQEEQDNDEPVVFYEMDRNFTLDLTGVKSEKGKNHSFSLTVNYPGWYKVTITASSTQSELAQIPLTLFTMGTANASFTWNGTNGKPVSYSKVIPMFSHFTAARIYFAQNGLDMISISFERTDREFRHNELNDKE